MATLNWTWGDLFQAVWFRAALALRWLAWAFTVSAVAPVALFAAIGPAHERAWDLTLSLRLKWVASLRHASLLLTAGRIRDPLAKPFSALS